MQDRFASIDYRALVDWKSRLAREWPFLQRAFDGISSRRILDLGCGPGEHAGMLARHGFEVVGVDSSPSMLDTARANIESDAVRFVAGDLADLDRLVEGTFGGAICLGNTLPSVRTRDDLARMLNGLKVHLAADGVLVLQLLNYEKIFATGQRQLPVTVRPTADGWLVFVRVMDPREGGDVLFLPTVLRYRAEGEPAVSIEGSERVLVHGWTRPELDAVLQQAGFLKREYFGSVTYAAYNADESTDLVVLARP